MIAYNQTWLENLSIREKAEQASRANHLSADHLERIFIAYPVGFYTPNFFVRIGLFLLTTVIGLFTLGLFFLFFLNGIDTYVGGILIFFGLVTYAALEVMVSKNHYRSGVDDALTWITGISIVGGLNMLTDISWQTNSIIIFVVSTWLFIRFRNMTMAGIACIAFTGIVFFSFTRFGDIAKVLSPFVVMIASAIAYILVQSLIKEEKWRHYADGFMMISIIAMVSFYGAGNYFVVRETSIAMFNLALSEGETIPLGWFFWIFTFAVPALYIIRGLQKKDAVFLRIGLALIAVIVFTVRYYYHVFSLEIAAVMGGVILISIAFALIKYLREPKYGFTYKKEDDPYFQEKLQIESLIIAQTFTQQSVDDGFRFGGGSGGGGGATGEY